MQTAGFRSSMEEEETGMVQITAIITAATRMATQGGEETCIEMTDTGTGSTRTEEEEECTIGTGRGEERDHHREEA